MAEDDGGVVQCSGPHCPRLCPLDDDLVTLQAPARQMLCFCSLRCVGRWCQEYGPTGWREAAAWPAQVVLRPPPPAPDAG